MLYSKLQLSFRQRQPIFICSLPSADDTLKLLFIFYILNIVLNSFYLTFLACVLIWYLWIWMLLTLNWRGKRLRCFVFIVHRQCSWEEIHVFYFDNAFAFMFLFCIIFLSIHSFIKKLDLKLLTFSFLTIPVLEFFFKSFAFIYLHHLSSMLLVELIFYFLHQCISL